MVGRRTLQLVSRGGGLIRWCCKLQAVDGGVWELVGRIHSRAESEVLWKNQGVAISGLSVIRYGEMT